MTDDEILEKLREYFQTKVNNLSGDEMAEGPFDDGTEYGDAWEAAAGVIDRRGGLRIRFEFGDSDPTLAAAAEREARAETEARPHDDSEKPDGVVYVVEGEEHGALYAAASGAMARDWIATYGPDSYPGVDLSVTALAVDRG